MSDEWVEKIGQNISQTINEVIINALNSGLPIESPDKAPVTMTLQEKLKRMKNPQCASDYGLSITVDELSTFKEGREFLAEMGQIIIHQKETIYKGV